VQRVCGKQQISDQAILLSTNPWVVEHLKEGRLRGLVVVDRPKCSQMGGPDIFAADKGKQVGQTNIFPLP